MRLVRDDGLTAWSAADRLRQRVGDEALLERARVRVRWALAQRPSALGERACATLDVALASSEDPAPTLALVRDRRAG